MRELMNGSTVQPDSEAPMSPSTNLPAHVQVAMKVDVLYFKSQELIDSREVKRLFTMIESPDQETHQVLREIISNKKKEIDNG